MQFRRIAAVCLAAPVLALAACGGGGNSDEDQITEVINDVGDNPAALCDHMSAQTLKIFGTVDDCKKQAEESGDKGSDVDIQDISIDGDKATAKISDDDGKAEVIFVKEDGDWVVDVDTSAAG